MSGVFQPNVFQNNVFQTEEDSGGADCPRAFEPAGFLAAAFQTCEDTVDTGNDCPRAFEPTGFYFGAFQTCTDAAVDTSGPAGGRIVATQFTRKRWKELEAAWKAQRAAENRSEDVQSDTKRRAFQKATKLAEHAIALAEAYDDLAVLKLTHALEAAAGADTLGKALEHSRRVAAISRFMIEEAEDEEDAILLLLSAW